MSVEDFIDKFYGIPEKITKPKLEGMVLEQLDSALDSLFGQLAVLAEAQGEPLSDAVMQAYKSIPKVDISEIGWSTSFETKEGGGQPSEARQQLSQFLDQIGSKGSDIQSKLKAVSDFVNNPQEAIKSFGETGGAANQVQKVLSYLVFYKTLVTIITHFNAASAGFTFESFLAVLLGGQQIPAAQAGGARTIADFTSEHGPISLKLYAEDGLHVGGSFTDLVGDLVRDGRMQYVAVTKKIAGEFPDQTANLKFYRFNITLDNVLDVLAMSRNGQKYGLLPAGLVRQDIKSLSPEKITGYAKNLPSKKKEELPPAEVTARFNKIFMKKYEAWPNKENLLGRQNLAEIMGEEEDVEEDAASFSAQPEREQIPSREPEQKAKQARPSTPEKQRRPLENKGFDVDKFLEELNFSSILNKAGEITATPIKNAISKFTKAKYKDTGLYELILDAAKEHKSTRKSASAKARQDKVSAVYFPPKSDAKADNAQSRAFYASADEEQKKALLQITHGYIQSVHFSLTEKMVQDVHAILKSNLSEAKKRMLHEQLFPEGQKNSLIGELYLSTGKIMELVNAASELLDKQVFQIFRNLSSLTQNLQGFFAGGLSDSGQAQNAKKAANNIGSAEELQTK